MNLNPRVGKSLAFLNISSTSSFSFYNCNFLFYPSQLLTFPHFYPLNCYTYFKLYARVVKKCVCEMLHLSGSRVRLDHNLLYILDRRAKSQFSLKLNSLNLPYGRQHN
ncbi:hypothetical protein HHI36_008978 [Cryptolaemus montrouzieri]|uniref:Uncharacterized protein n=1 Tax=Cryptolaemus montrouzieri TaxID=559131 RepID=A0ABD2MUW3_9CUCU